MRKLSFLVLFFAIAAFASPVFASPTNGTISATNKIAKGLISDFGRVNFAATTTDPYQVHVTDTALTGYAWGENVGWISLNCSNNTCSNANGNFKVGNDGEGNLFGYAWGQNTGWINFGPFLNSSTSPVTIDTSGVFHGYAWSQNFGWLSFNCGNTGSSCSPTSYKVSTDWRPQSVRDHHDGCTSHCDPFAISNVEVTSLAHSASITWDTNELAYDAIRLGTTTDYGFGTSTNPLFQLTHYVGYDPLDPDTTYYYEITSTTGDDPALTATETGEFTTLSDEPPPCTENCNNVPPCTTNCTSTNPPVVTVVPPAGPTVKTPSTPPPVTNPSNPPPPPVSSNPKSGPEISHSEGCGSLLNCAIQITKDSLNLGEGIASHVGARVIEIFNDPSTSLVTKTIATAGAVLGGVASAGALFATPLSFSELFFIPLRLWGLLLSALGLKKKYRPWGVVYDSVTKQPLDPAYVVLQDAVTRKEIATSITDLDGRYGFLLAPGRYKIIANKTNYSFPSAKLGGKFTDLFYTDLYFGEEIVVSEMGQIITKNIPMDPQNFDFNEFAKKTQQLTKFFSKHDVLIHTVSNYLFAGGFAVALIALFAAPAPYNVMIFVLYLALLGLRQIGLKPRSFGTLSTSDGTPLSFAIVHVYSAALQRELFQKVADKFGRYYCLVPDGEYSLKIDRKNPDESYTEVFSSEPFHPKNGLINTNFTV